MSALAQTRLNPSPDSGVLAVPWGRFECWLSRRAMRFEPFRHCHGPRVHRGTKEGPKTADLEGCVFVILS